MFFYQQIRTFWRIQGDAGRIVIDPITLYEMIFNR